MKLILSNKKECDILVATGERRMIQGVDRDILTFVFDTTYTLADLDELFSPENCESITLVEDETGTEYIHKDYTIRVELKKCKEEVSPATECSDAIFEERIFVSMAQRTYAENQMASITETLDVLVMESLN